jgi:transposase
MSRNRQAAMREFVFSEEVLAEIRHDRYHHPHPRVQRRMEILWLKSQGLIHAEIAVLADVSPRSVQRCLDDYEEGGLGQVRLLGWKGKACALDAHRRPLEQHFVENPPRSAREAQKAIEELTGIKRGLSQVRAFLKKSSGWTGAR